MFNDDCHFAHGEEVRSSAHLPPPLISSPPSLTISCIPSLRQEINEAYLNNDMLNDVDVHDPTRHRMDAHLQVCVWPARARDSHTGAHAHNGAPPQLPYPLATTRVAYFAFQVRAGKIGPRGTKRRRRRRWRRRRNRLLNSYLLPAPAGPGSAVAECVQGARRVVRAHASGARAQRGAALTRPGAPGARTAWMRHLCPVSRYPNPASPFSPAPRCAFGPPGYANTW